MVSDMLLFWCSWFKYRFIKLDLVTVGKFCFHFSLVLGGVVDCVNVKPARAWHLNHALRDAQNVCALTKVGTVLNWVLSVTKKKLRIAGFFASLPFLTYLCNKRLKPSIHCVK